MKTIFKIQYLLLVSVFIVTCTNSRENVKESKISSKQESVNNNPTRIIQKSTNKWIYNDRFYIQLPKNYQFTFQIIENSNHNQLGTIILDFQELKSNLSGYDFLRLFERNGSIITTETQFDFDCYNCNLIKADSVEIGSKKWYYILSDIKDEMNENKNWLVSYFANFERGKITLFSFSRLNANEPDNLNISEYLKLLGTIEYKE